MMKPIKDWLDAVMAPVHQELSDLLGYHNYVILKDFMDFVDGIFVGIILAAYVIAYLLMSVRANADLDDIFKLVRKEDRNRRKQVDINPRVVKTHHDLLRVIIGLVYTYINPNKSVIYTNTRRTERIWYTVLIVGIIMLIFGLLVSFSEARADFMK